MDNFATNKPLNILIILTDQLRADYLGCARNSKFATPNIDRLAEGMVFNECHSVNPICMPCRTALLTGKYSRQIGTKAMSGDLSPQHPTFLRELQKAGYTTAAVGKLHWHQGWPWDTPDGCGHDFANHPELTQQYGLDYVWEVSGKQQVTRNYCKYAQYLEQQGILQAYRAEVQRQGRNYDYPREDTFTGEPFPFDQQHYVDHLIGRQTRDYLESMDPQKPFCLMASFCGPHPPFDPPKAFLDLIDPDEAPFIPGNANGNGLLNGNLPVSLQKHLWKLRRSYRAMVALIDAEVGLILDQLEAKGILDQTVIFFTADHGEMLGDYGKLQKRSHYRPSCQVPFVIRHPLYLSRQRCDSPVEITDLTATVLEVAGLDAMSVLSRPWPYGHDSVPCRSLMPILSGRQDRIRDFAFSETQSWEMLRSERWKYVRNLPPYPAEKEILIDLAADPFEHHNLALQADPPAILHQLRQLLLELTDATPPAQLNHLPIRWPMP